MLKRRGYRLRRCVVISLWLLVLVSVFVFQKYAFAGKPISRLQGNNTPPTANSISKQVLKNGSFTFDLTSLVLDYEGDAVSYLQVQSMPKHGSLKLVGMQNEVTHVLGNDGGSLKRKYDAHSLNLRYIPSQNYTGQDSFSYIAVDSRGGQSEEGIISVQINEVVASGNKHSPSASDLSVATPVKSAVEIDLRSLALDLDGEPLTFSSVQRTGTFVKTSHGIVEPSVFFNYLPGVVGQEAFVYTVSDAEGNTSAGKITINITEEKRGGSFGVLLSSLSAGAGEEGSKLEDIKSFFFALPLKRVIESGSRGLLLLVLGSVLTLLFFYVVDLCGLSQNVLRFVYSGTVLLGVYIFKLGINSISLPVLFLGICLAGWGALALLPINFPEWRAYFLNLPAKHTLILLVLLANTLTLYYHFAAISLPAITLDSYSYIPIYNFFKHDILGWSRPEHSSRLLLPFLASVLPVENPVIAFKIVNVVFINLTVVILFKLWKDLAIKPYLIWMALLWLFFHQYGIIRFYNFWPTSVDVPSYFFTAALVYVVFKNQYHWLLLVCPLGALGMESILFYVIALLGFKLVCCYFSGSLSEGDRKSIVWIFLSIVLTLFLLYFLPLFLYPPPNSHTVHLVERFFKIYLGRQEALWLFQVISTLFYIYGAFLLLLVKNLHASYRNNRLFNALILLLIVNVALNIITVNGRVMFMGFPIIMTLVLISINSLPPVLVIIGYFLSIPLMKISVDFPLGLFTSSPFFTEFPLGLMSMYSIYMLLLYHFLSFFQDMRLGDKISERFNNLRRNIIPSIKI